MCCLPEREADDTRPGPQSQPVVNARQSTSTGYAFVGTTVLHVGAGFFLLGFTPEVDAMPPVYAVQLVAAPRPVDSEKPKPEVVQRQAETPPPTPQPVQRNTAAEDAPPPPPEPEDIVSLLERTKSRRR